MEFKHSAKSIKVLLSAFILVLFSTFTFAQQTVSGIVSDTQDQPISGVNVSVKGSQTQVVTDASGAYSLKFTNKDAVIVFSFTGFSTQEIRIGNQTTINAKLIADVKSLDDVVVVGYGTQSKRMVTGSISRVDMSKQADLPNTNITQALRGKVAGIQFIDNGRPGQDGTILIRGRNSLSASSNPLIVVDGIIFNGSLSDINPNDIQSLDILKDASSASIYGSRAANGVILVTSKKGTTEKPTIKFNAFNGISDYADKVKLLSPERYLQRVLDYRIQNGLVADPALMSTYLTKTEADNLAKGIISDPWDRASQQGRINSYDLSVSGKSATSNYYLSASMTDEKGLVFNDNQKRTTLRAKIDNRINSWLNIGLSGTFSRRDLSGESASLGNAYVSSPYGTWYYPDGEPTQFVVAEEQVSINPIRASILTTNEEIYDNLFSNFYGQVNLPFIKGLEYRVNYSPNFRWSHNYNFFRQDKYLTNNTTSASKVDQKSFDWLLENIVTYKRTIAQEHSIDLTLLYGRSHTGFESTSANANLLSSDVLGYNNLSLGGILTNTSSASATEGISSMARLNYAFKNKYIFTATARRDGSSVFAENNKFATFPSASIAWIASDEAFLKKIKFLDLMKLRVSYGSVGNQAISPYQSLSLSSITQYVYGDGGVTSNGIFTSNIANSDLKWETTIKSNAAIDFELFKGRLGGTIEVYNSTTKDLLVQRTLPTLTGFSSIYTNLGEVNNKGIEVTLNSVIFRQSKFEWSSSINFSYNQNKIIHLFGTDTNNDGKEDDNLANNWFIGQPINSYYDYVFDGIYQNGDVIPAGYKAGWARVKDLNSDGKLDAQDRKVVGSGGSPRFRYGITNNFRYKNLSLSVFINAMEGWVAPFSALNPSTTGRSLNQLDDGWWTAENKSNTRASLVYTNPLRHSWYVSRDFIRVQDVSLVYDFSKAFIKKAKIGNLRVFISAKNLYTSTDWLGSDPESGGTSSSDFYPMPRSFTFGLNMGF